MLEREKTQKEGLEGARKLEEHPVTSANFLKGTDLAGSSIPQPPEEPQPARPYGLPRWQTEPKNMIDDVMTKWTGPIKTEQDYEAVKDRLRYLEKYQPRLEGELRIRCDVAIRLLKNRMAEYEKANIHEFLATIARFTKNRIDTESQLVEAENYLSDLTERRVKLAEDYARAANSYMSRLIGLIRDYRERTYKPEQGGEKELTEKESRITGRVKGLGSPAGKVEATPLAEIAEVIRPFWTYVLRGGEGKPTWKHTVDSIYCRIETIVADKEWRLAFEDRDEAFGPSPDWDYDEPVLHIVRTNNDLTITIEKYDGLLRADIYYGDTLLWNNVGGLLHNKVGQSKTIPIPSEIIPPPPPPPPPPPLSLEWLKKYGPWIIGITLVGGTMLIMGKKK